MLLDLAEAHLLTPDLHALPCSVPFLPFLKKAPTKQADKQEFDPLAVHIPAPKAPAKPAAAPAARKPAPAKSPAAAKPSAAAGSGQRGAPKAAGSKAAIAGTRAGASSRSAFPGKPGPSAKPGAVARPGASKPGASKPAAAPPSAQDEARKRQRALQRLAALVDVSGDPAVSQVVEEAKQKAALEKQRQVGMLHWSAGGAGRCGGG